MNEILEQVENLQKFSDLLDNIKKDNRGPVLISGLYGDAKLQIIYALNKNIKIPMCIVTYNEVQARELVKSMKMLTDRVQYFPKREISSYDFSVESKELPYKRIEVLNEIRDKKVDIIVTTIEAIMQKMIFPDSLYKESVKLKIGNTYKMEKLKQNLIKMGYERNEIIDGRGQFSVRGGIIDISVLDNEGVRIEFWGDEIDSIRKFDITTQRSIEMIDNISIYPTHEMILELELEEVCKNIENAKYINKKGIEEDLEVLKSGKYVNKMDKYWNSFYKKQASFLDYIQNYTVCIDEYTKINQRIESLIKENNNLMELLIEKDRSLPDAICNFSEYKYNLNTFRNIFLESNDIASKEVYDFNIEGKEYNFSDVKFKKINVAEERKVVRRKQSVQFKQSEKIVFADLKIGDFVVHKIHGIGQFAGVSTIKANNVIKDYIKIKYKNDDCLYVPTDSLDNIRKYIGGEANPKIYKLGGKDWSNVKAKVKNNLREVAKELIELYAKRQKVQGFAFSKDTPWQAQFENSFQYVETEDQLKCIEEIKKDMENLRPMDRLLCGDVGYGKTEVAMRAAFKAVMDQKQVAYLVPTTILADQQYKEFKKRMEEYPIRVEVLNRFRTLKEQKEIVRKLKLGEIDIIIGTHRILSQDVEFKDLGLLIVDEEHRFGVKDKEKIKYLKNNVDVLTMTATPIPRTLHMSVVGVRDMSIIYEPPQNRKPVQTYVLEYDKEVIKEAILKEIEKQGQVFYLFNNVEGIEKKSEEISNLVPEAKVVFAHGKMVGKDIENIMTDFINKKSNVLVCTTILESGIDIPNANTIIVENADRLGLAQLYQIRGRVGRSEKQAFAYITYKRDKLITEVAEKRLKAIKEFTEFGSGFKIAVRDLEIRGAGSLLGEIQHRTYGTGGL